RIAKSEDQASGPEEEERQAGLAAAPTFLGTHCVAHRANCAAGAVASPKVRPYSLPQSTTTSDSLWIFSSAAARSAGGKSQSRRTSVAVFFRTLASSAALRCASVHAATRGIITARRHQDEQVTA